MDKAASEKKVFQHIISAVEEGIIITANNGTIAEFNRGAAHITGFSEAEALNKPLNDIINIYQDDLRIDADHYCPLEDFQLEGVIFKETALRLITKQESTKVVDFTVRKVKGSGDANISCIIMIKDTSKEVEFEKMKLDFISMSAHILRTPITILRGYSQILLREDTIHKLEEFEIDAINQISTASDDLRDRVENMLSLANIKEGAIIVNPVPLSIEGTIQTVVDQYRDNAYQKGLKIHFARGTEPMPRIYAEVGKVKDVLGKLIDNAIRYTDKGEIKIHVERETDHVKVSVQDTGMGIPEHGRSQLFTKFYRVKTKALDMADGHGLSLFTSKKIIEALGGEIGVISKETEGSTFYFTLPIFEEDRNKINRIV